MSFESFLQFWSVHNRQIIEFVFVSTFVLILFVIYRQFFAKSESHVTAGSNGSSVSIDTSEIEEKLKKILENQSTLRSPSSETSATPSPAADGATSVVNVEEVEKLKTEVKEKEKVIEDLKKTAATAPAGGNKEDTKKLEEKIKELEGRLQEYEIISEDIADLSFYKEENARLQKELSSGGVAKVAPATAPAAAPVAPPPVAEPAPAPVAAALAPKEEPPPPAPAAPVAATPEPAPAAPAAPKAATAEETAVVDDDILKEFAAAVEGQKQAEQPPEPQAVDPQKLTESKELMGEFENFIKKG